MSVNLPRESEGQSPEIAEGAAKHFERISHKSFIFFFHSFVFGHFLSKSIISRVEFWAGGGACPQGYPVPAFRFTLELDRAKCRTCISAFLDKIINSKVKFVMQKYLLTVLRVFERTEHEIIDQTRWRKRLHVHRTLCIQKDN